MLKSFFDSVIACYNSLFFFTLVGTIFKSQHNHHSLLPTPHHLTIGLEILIEVARGGSAWWSTEASASRPSNSSELNSIMQQCNNIKLLICHPHRPIQKTSIEQFFLLLFYSIYSKTLPIGRFICGPIILVIQDDGDNQLREPTEG
jgi:hypothetical protein